LRDGTKIKLSFIPKLFYQTRDTRAKI